MTTDRIEPGGGASGTTVPERTGRRPNPHACDLALLRRHEPILRYTRGELFWPMSIEEYLRPAALMRQTGDSTEQIAAPGSLDVATLAAFGRERHGEPLYLRYVEKPLDRKAYRQWRRRPDRDAFRASSGAAAVGLLARLILLVVRLSLVLRGKVPGGHAAAAQQQASSSADRRGHPYYGHVSREAGYLVLQYWFLYAMNDWRSTFAGVNDHEADWEQVTVFAVEHADGSTIPAWVAFSSHDEAGNDLRRRWDDSDMERVGDHPVVYAGAGSHSGACLKGEYLVTVEPQLPAGLERARRAIARVIPWSNADAGIGIPYIDYRRGDGISIGPGQEREWAAALIDDTTPWVRDYRGLWGLDTHDPLGGERAPAGPRYERDQRVRLSWAQPVAWAALDAEAPTAAQAEMLLRRRRVTLAERLAALAAPTDLARDELRAARAVDQAMGRSPLSPSEHVATALERVSQLRSEEASLRRELDDTVAAQHARPVRDAPHAHLRHRALPLTQTPTRWSWGLRVWASASASIMLGALGVILLRGDSGLVVPVLLVVAAMLVIEGILRGRLLALVLGAAACGIAIAAGWALLSLVAGNWRAGFGVLLLLAAVYNLGLTIFEGLRRR